MKLFALGVLLISVTAAHARDLDKLYSKSDFKISGHKFTAYVADDDNGRGQGLMFIEKIPRDTGMLFVFEEEHPLGFWMKNTLIPLAIGFFDKQGVLIDVQEMKVAASIMEIVPPSYHSEGPALFALEMNTGWFARNKIKIGSRLERLSPSRSQLLNEKLPLGKSARH